MSMIFKQVYFLSSMALKSVSRRLVSAFSTVVCSACAVGVLMASLTFASSLQNTIKNTGHDDQVIILSNGANAEIGSFVGRSAVSQIKESPGIARSSGNSMPLASANALVLVSLEQRNQEGIANATIRGVEWAPFQQMEGVEIIDGRPLRPGNHEIIVGKALQTAFVGIDVGSTIRFGNSDWSIVGTFTSGGDSHESELITDVEGLLSAYLQPAFQSVTAKLSEGTTVPDLARILGQDPRLNVNVIGEREYYESLSRPISGVVFIVAFVVGGIMSIGAIFAALNSMYIAIDGRRAEIVTLRAIGFSRFVVVASTLFEAWFLSLVGGVIGLTVVGLILEGRTTNTVGNGAANSSTITMTMHLTPELVGLALLVATAIGLIGGIVPSILMVRLPVNVAIRG